MNAAPKTLLETRELIMGYGRIQTEMRGTGGGRWMRRADAKQQSRRLRREHDRREAHLGLELAQPAQTWPEQPVLPAIAGCEDSYRGRDIYDPHLVYSHDACGWVIVDRVGIVTGDFARDDLGRLIVLPGERACFVDMIDALRALDSHGWATLPGSSRIAYVAATHATVAPPVAS